MSNKVPLNAKSVWHSLSSPHALSNAIPNKWIFWAGLMAGNGICRSEEEGNIVHYNSLANVLLLIRPQLTCCSIGLPFGNGEIETKGICPILIAFLYIAL
jgi:hypothetical protein